MITIILVALAFWFGFELGRKWDIGIKEAEVEAVQERQARGGVRLRPITIRR
jgi:hypothetical protein